MKSWSAHWRVFAAATAAWCVVFACALLIDLARRPAFVASAGALAAAGGTFAVIAMRVSSRKRAEYFAALPGTNSRDATLDAGLTQALVVGATFAFVVAMCLHADTTGTLALDTDPYDEKSVRELRFLAFALPAVAFSGIVATFAAYWLVVWAQLHVETLERAFRRTPAWIVVLGSIVVVATGAGVAVFAIWLEITVDVAPLTLWSFVLVAAGFAGLGLRRSVHRRLSAQGTDAFTDVAAEGESA